MADGECVIGPEVTLIERRGDKWVFDGGVTITDISKCKILPSPHDRRIVLVTADPKKKVVKPIIESPAPLVAPIVEPPPPVIEIPLPPPPVEEILEVVEETLIEKVTDMLGDNALGVVMVIGFAFLKKTMGEKQGKAQEEMDQKCSGRHTQSSTQTRELEAKIQSLSDQLSEMSSKIEWGKSSYASRHDMKRLIDRVESLEKKDLE